jgi:hypothetical protein
VPEIPKNATLRELVSHHKKYCAKILKGRLDAFAKEPLSAAISKAAFGKELCGQHIGHLCCLPTEALKKGGNLLLKKQTELKRCQSFDELYQKIKTLLKNISKLGPMYVYDVALRLGSSLGLPPEKVYLQRGAMQGAKILLGQVAKGKSVLEKNDFPVELQCLEPVEIEDFLCIFKKHLQLIKSK